MGDRLTRQTTAITEFCWLHYLAKRLWQHELTRSSALLLYLTATTTRPGLSSTRHAHGWRGNAAWRASTDHAFGKPDEKHGPAKRRTISLEVGQTMYMVCTLAQPQTHRLCCTHVIVRCCLLTNPGTLKTINLKTTLCRTQRKHSQQGPIKSVSQKLCIWVERTSKPRR